LIILKIKVLFQKKVQFFKDNGFCEKDVLGLKNNFSTTPSFEYYPDVGAKFQIKP